MTTLAESDVLPLTCTRSGTCCHGKEVWLNPWELACLAAARGQPPAEFCAAHTDLGGIRLRFDGPLGYRGLPACSQYDPASGCRAHAGRPLACRLYPLGRERRAGKPARYIHEGRRFPCLAGCPEVSALPHLRVADYVAGQGVAAGAAVQDAYVELMQDLAEGAFVLLFDSGLMQVRGGVALKRFKHVTTLADHERVAALPPDWLAALMLPELDPREGLMFAAAHHAALQERAQTAFSRLSDPAAIEDAMALMLGLALHCGRACGVDIAHAARTWIGRLPEVKP